MTAIGTPPNNLRHLKPRSSVFLGPFHVLLEMLFPDLCPWPIEHVRDPVLDDLPRRNRSRVSIDWVERPGAFRPSRGARPWPIPAGSSCATESAPARERLRIVNHRFPVEADELSSGITNGRQDLDRLETIAPFPARMLVPALNIGRPGDQRVPVPEPDGVPVPLRNVRPQRETPDRGGRPATCCRCRCP